MPELSRFYGIIVTMYVKVGSPHSLPCIYAKYGGKKAVYSLEGKVLCDGLPSKQDKLMQAWMALHEQELQDNRYLASHRSMTAFRRAQLFTFTQQGILHG